MSADGAWDYAAVNHSSFTKKDKQSTISQTYQGLFQHPVIIGQECSMYSAFSPIVTDAPAPGISVRIYHLVSLK